MLEKFCPIVNEVKMSPILFFNFLKSLLIFPYFFNSCELFFIFLIKKLQLPLKLQLSPTALKITFVFLNHSTANRLFHLRLHTHCIPQLNFLLCKNSHCHHITQLKAEYRFSIWLCLVLFLKWPHKNWGNIITS